MSLVDQELTLNTMDITSGSRTYTKMMGVISGSRTYTEHDGCH